MSRWSSINAPRPESHPDKVELTGLSAMCRMCPEQSDTVIFLPEAKAITWKCKSCEFINVIEDFNLI